MYENKVTTPYEPVNPSRPLEEEYVARIEGVQRDIAHCSEVLKNVPSDDFRLRIYALERDLKHHLYTLENALIDIRIKRWMADNQLDSLNLEEIEKAARAVLQDHPHPWRTGSTIRDANGDLVAENTSGSTDWFLMRANPIVVLVLIAEIKRLQDHIVNHSLEAD